MYVWVHVPLLQGKCFTPGKLAQLVSFEGLCNINVTEQSEQKTVFKIMHINNNMCFFGRYFRGNYKGKQKR